MPSHSPLRVVLVHDWLIHMRGGERVLEALAELYPNAVIYTLFCNPKKISPALQRMKIKTSWLQIVPGIRIFYRWLLPVLPWIIQSFKIKDVDLVISSSHCVAKGIQVPEGALHVCYCHTPMRYLWGFEEEYFRRYPFFIRFFIKWVLARLRSWDLRTNQAVDFFISNSENVKKRIRDYYQREAVVIYPPLDTQKFYPIKSKPQGDYYLVVSAFVPYKRVDIVIEAFNSLVRNLVIVGSGPLEKEYRKMRQSERISFLGSVADADLRQLYAGAKALIFPTEEDFGIVPLEAQACGTPVIAYRRGGACESVKAGIFFDSQTSEAIQEAVMNFESKTIDRTEISEAVGFFNKKQFKEKIEKLIPQLLTKEDLHVAVS